MIVRAQVELIFLFFDIQWEQSSDERRCGKLTRISIVASVLTVTTFGDNCFGIGSISVDYIHMIACTCTQRGKFPSDLVA